MSAHPPRLSALLVLLSSMSLSSRPLFAQTGAFLAYGRVLAGTPTASAWRLTVENELVNPIGADLSAMILPGTPRTSGRLYGVGADLTLFSAARGVPTLFVGVAGGIGTGGQDKLWASGSFGLRMPVVLAGPLRVMAEGRWRSVTASGRNGIEVAIAVGYHAPPAGPPKPESAGLWVPPPIADNLRARGIPAAKAALLGNVVTTAVEEMGQPYVWGGTGNGSGGFDCSGLIQYAYGRYSVPIPRTAAGQAKAGVAIRKEMDALLPGDILVFAEHGEQPTHVGLYVGEGRFIHSASKSVILSRLAEDDPEGKYWLRRWVGVRRVIE